MDRCPELLAIMADGKFHSGEILGRQLSVSRAAVWKMISSLRQYGLDVHSVRGKGHRLSRPVEFLDRQRLLAHIDADCKREIRHLTIHRLVNSTSQFLLDRIAAADPEFHGHVVLAEYQSSGRGRRRNQWISPLGAGICFSIGWRFDPAPDPITVISLAAGVSVMRTLHRFDIHDAGLKWPNDIFWRSCKLGGVLLEMQGESAGPCHIVLGIGLNFSFPENIKDMIDQPWIDIAGIEPELPSRNIFAASLISDTVRLLVELDNHGTQTVIDEWRKFDCTKGKLVTLKMPRQSVSGRVLGIDNEGSLLMSVNNKVQKFSSGEISLRVKS